MAWFILVVAGCLEVVFTSCLGKARYAEGTSAVLWYAGFVTALCISMALMVKATRTLPLGTAYAVWTGIGAAGTAIVGLLLFDEPAEFWRLFFIVTLIGSIAGLKLVEN